MSIKIFWKSAVCVFLLTMAFSAAAVSGVEAKPARNAYFYDSPEAAAKALVSAIRANNKPEILNILGTSSKELIESGDEISDNAERAAFVRAYEEKNALVPGKNGKSRVLEIGAKGWPFPVPLVLEGKSGRWRFESKAGMEEMTNRRVGGNELSAMQVCLAYVDAQNEYYKLNPDKAAVEHFARKITSSPGKHDGLYWETKAGEAPSPLGALFAVAANDGDRIARPDGKPYHGYRYHILASQGEHAMGGAHDYMERDLMVGGFALVAYPDVYGTSGVMTFIVNQDGVVYEKNLGKNTAALAQQITRFDPDKTWSKAVSLK